MQSLEARGEKYLVILVYNTAMMNIRFVVGLAVVIGALLLYHIYELKERLHAEKRRVMELQGEVSSRRLEEQDFRNLQMQIASQRSQQVASPPTPPPTAPGMRIRGANEEQNEYPAHVNYPTPHHIPTRPMETSSSNGPISAANEFMNEHPAGIPATPNF